MKALIKSKAEPGLWLADVPEPTIGINDVLIRVDRTGICGTDLHIYKWDAWAQKTIPVPMVDIRYWNEGLLFLRGGRSERCGFTVFW